MTLAPSLSVAEIVTYIASCPTCSGDATWHAVASLSGDLARTTVTYRVDCDACEPPAESGTPGELAWLRPISQLGWLGRSA